MIAMQDSATAKLCAFARAYHSSMGKQKIFDDYLAYDMVGAEDYDRLLRMIGESCSPEEYFRRYGFESTLSFEEMNRCFAPIILPRTAFAEQALGHFADAWGSCQYIICGAGLDTFAFRNQRSDIRIFELDHPDTQAHKLERIQALRWNIPENVCYAGIDFTRDKLSDVLLAAGYRPEEPAFFSILGVTYYLSAHDFSGMVHDISYLSRAGNQLVFDFPDETTFFGSGERVQELAALTARLGEPMQQGFSVKEVRQLLRRQGVRIVHHAAPEEIQREFFGNRLDKQRAFENIHFILGQREENYYGNL